MAQPDTSSRNRLKDGERRADLGSPRPTSREMPDTSTQQFVRGADGDTKTGADSVLDPEERRRRIEVQAYMLFLERGAIPGAALDDWLTAERQVGWRD